MTEEIRAKIDEINRTKTEDVPIVCEEPGIWFSDTYEGHPIFVCSNCMGRTNQRTNNCWNCGKPMREERTGDIAPWDMANGG